ncbi:uncharacterized protein [Montipora foliosa]|uniref:uncharacterized protein n=1 Tax=Montipora foliosa TaxID=591990 RepID=UPI0035F1CE90
MRQKVFDDGMEEEIDIFDLECKEWGFCLRELFGLGLGTGDYGHLTVEHASMLLRNFTSLRHYSNQGFEAAHKLQKQIFSRATNFVYVMRPISMDQILTHQYAEKILFLRLCFRNAKECARKGKKFHFQGCSWRNTISTKKWSTAHKHWIETMDELFTTFMCKDVLSYEYTDKKCCIVSESDHPRFEYNDTTWENIIAQKMTEHEWNDNEGTSAQENSHNAFQGPQLSVFTRYSQTKIVQFNIAQGQQCSIIALTALFYSTLTAVDCWKTSNVDEILLLGDKIHFHQLCQLKNDPSGDQQLTLDEVPSGVMMLNHTFSNESQEIVAGTIREKGDLD